MTKIRFAAIIIILALCLAACGSGISSGLESVGFSSGGDAPGTQNGDDSAASETAGSAPSQAGPDAGENAIEIQIGTTVLTATLADNPSAKEFAKLLKNGEVTVVMSDYGNFEKVGGLPQRLTRSDEQLTTEPGDIILYQGDRITIYYDTNSWNFTRLGKIDVISQDELKALLGDGDVTVTFRLCADASQKP